MSVCVWSNVLDYTLSSRIQQVIQHLRNTLEHLGTTARSICPKQIVLSSTPTDPTYVEQQQQQQQSVTRHRFHDSGSRDGPNRQSSRHRRSKPVDPGQPLSESLPTSQFAHVVQSVSTSQSQPSQTDLNSKSPIDTSESTSTAANPGSTVTQIETPMSQSISESSPSVAEPPALIAHSASRLPSAYDGNVSNDLVTNSQHGAKSAGHSEKHKSSLGTHGKKKKYKRSHLSSDWVDDEQLPLSQSSAGMRFLYLCTVLS